MSRAAGESALAVDRDRVAALEADLDVLGRVGRLLRVDGALVDVRRRLLGGVLEHLAFGGGVQEVRVDRERRLAALVPRDRDLVRLGELEEPSAGGEVPFAPRRDDADRRVERIGRELEADLVVALAGGAVGDGVGAGRLGDLDEALGDQRAGDRGAEQVEALVLGVGAEHREDEVADELVAQILDVDVLGLHAEELGLAARRLELLALAEVGGEGDDLAAVLGLEPLEDDRGVEAAGIGEHDLLRRRHSGLRWCGSRSRLGTFAGGGNAVRKDAQRTHNPCTKHMHAS